MCRYLICVMILLAVILVVFTVGRVLVFGWTMLESQKSGANSDIVPEDGVAVWNGGDTSEGLLTLVNAEHPCRRTGSLNWFSFETGRVLTAGLMKIYNK